MISSSYRIFQKIYFKHVLFCEKVLLVSSSGNADRWIVPGGKVQVSLFSLFYLILIKHKGFCLLVERVPSPIGYSGSNGRGGCGGKAWTLSWSL